MNLSSTDRSQIEALLGRTPSEVELHIFDTMWSEHCSYKSSKEVLKKHLPITGSEVALGIGEDAGIIRFAQHEGKSYCIAISHESHNHPSQILPIEGAATGVGGVVRDVYCMGADVIGVLNSLHFGINKDGHSGLVDDIATNVVIGVSDYANPLGVPVLGGETLFHESYNDNCLVNVASIGLVEESQIIRSRAPEAAKTEPYDVILFGKSTDATGFGGASFSSATLDKDNESVNIGAVQIHDPFLKRVIVEAIKALIAVVHEKKILIGFKDLGAGGISCATSEIAAAGGFGVDVDLDAVNCALPGLSPEIIACSETQERFCLTVPSWFSPQVLKIFNEDFALPQLYPNAGAAVIGKVSTSPRYKLFSKGVCVCDLPIEAITTEVRANREIGTPEIKIPTGQPFTIETAALQTLGESLLALPNNISKRFVYRYFDHSVQARTVLYPGEGDAVVTVPVENCLAGLATTIDSNLYGNVDPYVSGAAAVAESIRNLVCVGARPIAITDCLNYGNPENPSSFYDFNEGVKGIGDAARALGFIAGEALPVISGNVSFYNDSKQGAAVVPSPVIVALGKLEDYRLMRPMIITQAGLILMLVGKRYAEFGGTQLQDLVGGLGTTAPQVRFEDEAKQNQAVHGLISDQLVTSCHDISSGGMWLSMVEMLLGERGHSPVGASLEVPAGVNPFSFLFSENGGYLLAIDPIHVETVTQKLSADGVNFSRIGYSVSDRQFVVSQQGHGLATWDLAQLNAIRESKN